MKRVTLATVGLLALVLVIGYAHASTRRIALVIGNDSYENVPDLAKARNDARAVAERLKALGFEVVQAEDVGRRAMSRAVVELENRIEKDDVVVMFYAGHGFAIDGRNYLLPVDIPEPAAGEEEIVKDEAFLADDLASRFRQKGASTAVLVLDACRNNPFDWTEKRGVGTTRGLSRMAPPEGVFVLFSAGQNQSALDGLGENDSSPNSVFTRSFLKELDQPGRSLIEIAKATQVSVRGLAESVGAEQSPAYYDQVIGNVVLNPGDGSAGDGDVEGFVEGQSKVALLPPVEPTLPKKAGPIASFSRSNAGWMVYVSLPEAAIQFGYRVGEEGGFTDPGLTDSLDQRTGKRMPKTLFELPNGIGKTKIYVTWRDPRGEEAGIHEIVFDPDFQLKDGAKKMLKDSSNSWLSFREYNGLLVYFSHILSFRCAVDKIRIGVGKEAPNEEYELPACDPQNPYSVPDGAEIYRKLPKATKSVSLEIIYYDGESSGVRNFPVQF